MKGARLGWFALVCSAACSVASSSGEGQSPGRGEVPAPSGDVGAGGSGTDGADAGGGEPDAGPRGSSTISLAGTGAWEPRSCDVVLRYVPEPGVTSVRVAGEFTQWDTGAMPLARKGDAFELSLSPGAGLSQGQLYAYKLVVDGRWILDPANRYRKMVGGVMNSGLRLPSCDAGPETNADRAEVTRRGDAGDMRVRLRLRTAKDGAPLSALSLSLDGAPLASTHEATVLPNEGAVVVALKDLPAGKHTLRATLTDEKGRQAEPVALPFWVEAEPFDLQDGFLYMFMIDRFANGNAANDKPLSRADVHYDVDWHGGDLEGALAVLKSGYFEALGVRTIWLSPVNAQTDDSGIGSGGYQYSAYHGYWPVRARSVEPRFGGDAALREFVTEAHKRGLRVLVDLINNQVHEKHEYVSAFPSWFRTSCKCGDDAVGCGWSQRPLDCMFQPYLPDINWNVAAAERQFIDDAVHWLDTFDVDGFRVDAVKHVEVNSIYNMRAEIHRRFEQGGARIYMLGETAVGEHDQGTFAGETFRDGYEWIDAYTGPAALDGQFDFPTRHNMADGLLNETMGLDAVERQIRKAETRYRPGNRHVRFLNGHDNPRIASVAARDTRLGCAWDRGCRDERLPPPTYDDPAVLGRLRRALVVLATLPGVPFLYSGDEVAMAGGPDPDMRRNMVFADPALASVQMKPWAGAKATAAQSELLAWARKVGQTRTKSSALRRGTRVPLVTDDPSFWAYAYRDAQGQLAIVVVNRGAAVRGRALPVAPFGKLAGRTLRPALGQGTIAVTADALAVDVAEGGAEIFVAE